MGEMIEIQCNPSYDPIIEALKYAGTVVYLGIGLFSHLAILRAILTKKSGGFKQNSFFQILSTDSFFSTILIVLDVFFNRLFMYITPLCPLAGPLFSSPSPILKIVYTLQHHSRFAKSLTQTFMVLNRMSCVLAPSFHSQIWRKSTRFAILLTFVLPIAGTWNIIISRQYGQTYGGGFAINYRRAVQWASLSLFQSIYILTALAFTVTCTGVTLLKLLTMPDRLKPAEKSLCFTSIFISITFLLVAITQLLFATCASCRGDSLYGLQASAFDVFTVGSALIMIVTNQQLKEAIFHGKKGQNDRIMTGSMRSSI